MILTQGKHTLESSLGRGELEKHNDSMSKPVFNALRDFNPLTPHIPVSASPKAPEFQHELRKRGRNTAFGGENVFPFLDPFYISI